MKVFISSGGGVRVGSSFGASEAGEVAGKIQAGCFDWYAGTSAGALDAALSANGWTGGQKSALFLQTDFGKFFKPFLIPFGLRKNLIGLNIPISLRKLHKFYESLTIENPFGPPLIRFENLLINSVDTQENIHVVYCEVIPPFIQVNGQGYSHNGRIKWIKGAFSNPEIGIAGALCDSQALPGLRSIRPHMKDGGIAQNPLLSVFPVDSQILMINLGYAGKVEKHGHDFPVQVLDEALYAYEFRAHEATSELIQRYPDLTAIHPGGYHQDSSDFAANATKRAFMVADGFSNTMPQWRLAPSFI